MKIFRITNDDWVPYANRWLCGKIAQYNAQSAYLAAGETPKPLYASWRKNMPAHLRWYQVDEIITGSLEGRFARYFEKELPDVTVHQPLSYVQAELAILSIGMNGHVAFHEPKTPLDFCFGEVVLAPETASNLGCDTSVQARTYGVGAFLRTKAVLLLVCDNLAKQDLLNELVEGHGAFPAAALRAHRDLTILTNLPERKEDE